MGRLNDLLKEFELSAATEIVREPAAIVSGSETARVLVHLFRSDEKNERDIGVMSTALRMERNVLQCHLDRLYEAKLAESVGSNFVYQHVYWALTPEGGGTQLSTR